MKTCVIRIALKVFSINLAACSIVESAIDGGMAEAPDNGSEAGVDPLADGAAPGDSSQSIAAIGVDPLTDGAARDDASQSIAASSVDSTCFLRNCQGFIDSRAPPPPSGDGADSGDASQSGSDGAASDAGGPTNALAQPGAASSCLAILRAAPTSRSGVYVISSVGEALAVYCDMGFGGGGWTLVQSTNGGACTPANETAAPVELGSCAYMPVASLTALANLSSAAHVRTASGSAAPTAYITSATLTAIRNLRKGLITNANEAVGDSYAEGTAWTVVGDPGHAASQGLTPESILTFSCSVAGEQWPAVYHACGNGTDGFALDVVNNFSIWNWGIMPHVNVPMEVYVR